MTQAMCKWSKTMSANETTNGFKFVQERATKFANQNAEMAAAFVTELAKAKDMQEVFALQSRHAQTQI